MSEPIPSKTLDAFEELLKTLINGIPEIKACQIDDLVRIWQSSDIHLSTAYINVNGSPVKYINKLAFSPAQIDAIESFAEDWHNGIVYRKHYDADESREDKLFTEFYKHFKA